jgi:hypothetical protein
VYVPKGTCDRLVNGSMQPKAYPAGSGWRGRVAWLRRGRAWVARHAIGPRAAWSPRQGRRHPSRAIPAGGVPRVDLTAL